MDTDQPNIHPRVRNILEPLFRQIEKEFNKIITENEELKKSIKQSIKPANSELSRKVLKNLTPRKSHSIKKSSTNPTFTESHIVLQFKDHNDVVNEITKSKSTVATCSIDKTVKLWDPITGKSLATYNEHSGSVNSVRFHPHLDILLTASGDRSAHIVSSNLAGKLQEFRGHKDTVSAADWFPALDQVITASFDQNLHVYAVETGQIVTRLAGHSEYVRNVVTSGSLALSASADCTFRLWDLRASRYAAKTYSLHTQPVNSVIFGPNDLVISASDDRTVKILDLRQSMDYLADVSLPAAPNRIAINKDNSIIAAPLDSGSIFLLDKTGGEIGKLRSNSAMSHVHAVTSVCWLEGSGRDTLLSCGADSRAFAWAYSGLI